MKLYAITTSERASKGQGGNKKLEIELTIGSAKERIPFGKMVLTQNNDVFILMFQDRNTNIHNLDSYTLKGKKQKSDNTGKYYCTWCGDVEAQEGTICKHCDHTMSYQI